MQSVYDTDAFLAWRLIEFLATWWLQASILLALGLLTAYLLRRPVYQATVYRACLVGVLLCPALALTVHWCGGAMLTLDLRGRLMPAEGQAAIPAALDATSFARPTPADPFSFDATQLVQTERATQLPGQPQGQARDAIALQRPSHQELSLANGDLPTDAVDRSSAASPQAIGKDAYPWLSILWLAIGAWALGACVLLFHLAMDLRYARWLVKQSVPTDDSINESCRQLAVRFGTRQPAILVNPLMSSPCLIGQWRPVILLPEDTHPNHCQRVFMHELAHLKRGDWAWTIAGRVASALLWFHPLVWWLHRSHLSVAEDICDDYVIQHDGNREDYLQQLIDIAQHSLPVTVAAGLSIVGFRSKLGKRALRILDTTRTLSTHVSPRFLTAALIAAWVSVSSVAMLQIGQSNAADDAGNESVAASDEPKTSSTQDDSATTSRRDDAERTYMGKVVDVMGQPIAGAQLTAINNRGLIDPKEKVLAQTTSDSNGRYSLTFKPEEGDNRVRVTAQGYGENFVGSTELHELFTKGQSQLDFQLGKEQPIIGRIVDTEGKPVPNVKLQILHVMLPKSSEAVDKWSNQKPSELIKSGDFMMWNDPRVTATIFPASVTHDYALGALDKVPTFQTDQDGRFRIEGYSADTLLHVRLSGPSIAVWEVQLVARTMPVVHAFGHWVRNGDYRHYGNDATLVVSPTQLIRGRVTAAESQSPLVGVPVVVKRLGDSVWLDDAVQTVTNQDGQFELSGAPLGGSHIVEVRPAADQPYFATYIELAKTNEPTPLVCNFVLPRCKWIRGRVTDEQGNGIVAKLNLHPFRDNPYVAKYPNFDPTISGQSPDFGTLTNERGEFRIKAIPGHSLLTGFCADYNLSPLYFPNRSESLLEKIGGEQMPKVLHPFSADFFDTMVEVELQESEEEIAQDLVFKKGIERVLKIVDERGRPLEAIDIFGQTWTRALQPSAKLENSSIKLAGLGPEESRVVVLMTTDGRSGKHLNVSGRESAVIETQLERCSSIRGRVLNSDGEPAKDVRVEVSLQNTVAPDTWARNLQPMTTNDRGEFSMRLPPGGMYTFSAYSSAGPNFFVRIKPMAGDDYDLGDLTTGVERVVQDASEYRVKSADGRTELGGSVGSDLGLAGQLIADETAKSKLRTADAQGNKPGIIEGTRVIGKFIDEQGKAIAGAHVAIIAARKSGQMFTGQSDALATGVTNAEGAFELSTNSASNQTYGATRLVARAEGKALLSCTIDLETTELWADPVPLRDQSLIRIKLVDLEGKPAKKIQVSVQCVMASRGNGDETMTEYHQFSNPPAAWIGPLTTDDQGLLIVPGLVKDQGIALLVEPTDQFAIQGIALNTGWKEERAANDATYRSIVKNLKENEVPTIPLAPARIFEGTVRLGKNGPPAANAKVRIWASQQPLLGSMISIEGQTDAAGRYRMIPYPGVRYGIQAYPPENEPYQISQVRDLKWDETKSTLITDIDLPECAMARGKLVDAATGEPVVEASVQYWPMATNPNDREGMITGWQGIKRTNAAGEFAIPVLAGEGWLIIQSVGSGYAVQTMTTNQLMLDKPGGRRAYAHAFQKLNIKAGQQPQPLRIELKRGHDVDIEVTDQAGKPVDGAHVYSRLMLGEDLIAGWRGFRAPATQNGKLTLRGLNEDGDIPLYILDAKRKLGATLLINRQMKSAKVVLQPCGQADITLSDNEGKPTRGLELMLSMIVTPGPSFMGTPDPESRLADEDFLPNVDEINHREVVSDDAGKLTIPALIPGATYRYFDYQGQPHDFVAKSGETIHLGTLERKK